MFLANYADGLADIPLDKMIADFDAKDAVASLAGVSAGHSFHTVDAGDDGLATRIGPMASSALLLNGGFFVLRQEIFDYIEPGDELVEQPFRRLSEKRRWPSTGTAVSGERWTLSRTRSPSTAWRPRETAPG